MGPDPVGWVARLGQQNTMRKSTGAGKGPVLPTPSKGAEPPRKTVTSVQLGSSGQRLGSRTSINRACLLNPGYTS